MRSLEEAAREWTELEERRIEAERAISRVQARILREQRPQHTLKEIGESVGRVPESVLRREQTLERWEAIATKIGRLHRKGLDWSEVSRRLAKQHLTFSPSRCEAIFYEAIGR